MNLILSSCIVVLAMTSTCSLDAMAQTLKRDSPKSVPSLAHDALKVEPIAAVTNSKPTPFQPVFFASTEKMSAYVANEPVKIYQWVESQIQSIPGKPDQFSTSEERQRYEAAVAERMGSIRAIPFIGHCQHKYKADQEQFEVKVLMMPVKDFLADGTDPEALKLRKLLLAGVNQKDDTYASQNAYGATVEVYRTVSDEYVLTFPAGPENEPSSAVVLHDSITSNLAPYVPYKHKLYYLQLSAKLSPADARASDKQLACLLVFSLSKPFIVRYKERKIPTRDSPFDTTSNGYALFGRLDQVAVFNKSTGELYDQAARAGLQKEK